MYTEFGGTCFHCGAAFTGRANRKFCSDTCRKANHKREVRRLELLDERTALQDSLRYYHRIGSPVKVRFAMTKLSRVTGMIEELEK